MIVKLVETNQKEYIQQIRDIFWEYLVWANSRINQEYNITLDIASAIEDDMAHLGKFMPPSGCLLLSLAGNQLDGIACMKILTPEIGEIKRMYVRQDHRGKGLGRSLVQRLIEEAGQTGYRQLRLDSARFMQVAHHLYRSMGFHDIQPYKGSEIPVEYQGHWVFMEMDLAAPK